MCATQDEEFTEYSLHTTTKQTTLDEIDVHTQR